ncbi:probable acyl-[acyl-carrier-protein]--UDP-N-acetylglucosamine O-acyltransferase, mitochondrial [Tanacetum coccineum]
MLAAKKATVTPIDVEPMKTSGSSPMETGGEGLKDRDHLFTCQLVNPMYRAIVGDNLPEKMIIGCNNVIGHHAVVICFLEVGDNNEIREHVSIHRSSKPCDRTVIGDNNLIMGSCHIAHDCKVGSNSIFANNTLLAGHVLVEDHAHTAGAIVVHQFCHIGSFCFIGGGSVVPWTNERPLENRELNAIIGAWFTLWRD